MRTYDRAEEKRIQVWHAERLTDVYYWEDYKFDGEDLRPFWKPRDSWYYDPHVNIDDVRKGKLMTLLLKLRLNSPRDVIHDLDW